MLYETSAHLVIKSEKLIKYAMFVLQIFFHLFVKEESAAEIGTSYASMNRNGKTNAKKGPDKDYNSYKEFFERKTEAHLLAQWMTFVGMQKCEGKALLVNNLKRATCLSISAGQSSHY